MICTYTIRPIADLNDIDYSKIQQDSADTVRKNDQDGNEATHFIVKWDSTQSMPTTIYELDPRGDEDVKTCYTAAELKDYIKDDSNW